MTLYMTIELGAVDNHGKNGKKTRHTENRKNHGEITAFYIASNLC